MLLGDCWKRVVWPPTQVEKCYRVSCFLISETLPLRKQENTHLSDLMAALGDCKHSRGKSDSQSRTVRLDAALSPGLVRHHLKLPWGWFLVSSNRRIGKTQQMPEKTWPIPFVAQRGNVFLLVVCVMLKWNEGQLLLGSLLCASWRGKASSAPLEKWGLAFCKFAVLEELLEEKTQKGCSSHS